MGLNQVVIQYPKRVTIGTADRPADDRQSTENSQRAGQCSGRRTDNLRNRCDTYPIQGNCSVDCSID